MTNATRAPAELAEKGADVDVLRQMVQFMAQRLMELDVDARAAYARHELPLKDEQMRGPSGLVWLDVGQRVLAIRLPHGRPLCR